MLLTSLKKISTVYVFFHLKRDIYNLTELDLTNPLLALAEVSRFIQNLFFVVVVIVNFSHFIIFLLTLVKLQAKLSQSIIELSIG